MNSASPRRLARRHALEILEDRRLLAEVAFVGGATQGELSLFTRYIDKLGGTQSGSTEIVLNHDADTGEGNMQESDDNSYRTRLSSIPKLGPLNALSAAELSGRVAKDSFSEGTRMTQIDLSVDAYGETTPIGFIGDNADSSGSGEIKSSDDYIYEILPDDYRRYEKNGDRVRVLPQLTGLLSLRTSAPNTSGNLSTGSARVTTTIYVNSQPIKVIDETLTSTGNNEFLRVDYPPLDADREDRAVWDAYAVDAVIGDQVRWSFELSAETKADVISDIAMGISSTELVPNSRTTDGAI